MQELLQQHYPEFLFSKSSGRKSASFMPWLSASPANGPLPVPLAAVSSVFPADLSPTETTSSDGSVDAAKLADDYDVVAGDDHELHLSLSGFDG